MGGNKCLRITTCHQGKSGSASVVVFTQSSTSCLPSLIYTCGVVSQNKGTPAKSSCILPIHSIINLPVSGFTNFKKPPIYTKATNSMVFCTDPAPSCAHPCVETPMHLHLWEALSNPQPPEMWVDPWWYPSAPPNKGMGWPCFVRQVQEHSPKGLQPGGFACHKNQPSYMAIFIRWGCPPH